MAGDETILADHDRQSDRRVFRDPESHQHVIVGFLVVFGKQLDPSRIPCTHGIGMVAVDIDRSCQGSVDIARARGSLSEDAI